MLKAKILVCIEVPAMRLNGEALRTSVGIWQLVLDMIAESDDASQLIKSCSHYV
jgi:hypothetical protein